jgi:PRMT5 arginine-N-methyltransferase/ribosomal protein L11 methyltransferase PrmA
VSLIIDEHRQYLSDRVRVSAYRNAIHEVVEPGAVVLDLGAGTGIMGLLACEARARRVYSIEADSIIGLNREICRANGFADRITFIKGLSTQVELPEKVDVVVSDQIGRFGFEAGILDFFRDARERFLKPSGVLVPSQIELLVAPIESEAMFDRVEFWNNSTTGFDLSPVRALAANTGYPVKFRADDILGAPLSLAKLRLGSSTYSNFTADGAIAITRQGVLHGLGGWFSAQLSPRTTMTNSPLATQSINRRNVFFPLDRPVMVEPGDDIRIRMHVISSEPIVTWRVHVLTETGSEKASFTQSVWNGVIVCKEDLARTQLRHVPKLSPRGRARLTVLSLCDDARALADIERETFDRHPDLFRTADEAALFVAEVVTRYSV